MMIITEQKLHSNLSCNNYFCQIWMEHKTGGSLHGPVISQVKKGVFQPNGGGYKYISDMILCDISPTSLTNNTVPKYIAVVDDANKCIISANILPVQPHRKEPFIPKYNFTICVSPIALNYSYIGEFMEFFEYHQMFGVDHFMVYNYQIGQDLWPFIKSYQEDGILELLNWKLPVPSEMKGKLLYYFGQHLAFHDCLYKARQTSRYVSILDLDEIIVPLKHQTWLEMINYVNANRIESQKTFNVFIFKNAFFRKDWKPDQTFMEDKMVEKYKLRTLMYTTRESSIKVALVTEKDALLFHYRNFAGGKTYINPSIKSHVETKMFSFKHKILERVKNRLEKAKKFGFKIL